jgi:hypothetical protein
MSAIPGLHSARFVVERLIDSTSPALTELHDDRVAALSYSATRERESGYETYLRSMPEVTDGVDVCDVW